VAQRRYRFRASAAGCFCARRLFAGLSWRVVRLEEMGIGSGTTAEPPAATDTGTVARELLRRVRDR